MALAIAPVIILQSLYSLPPSAKSFMKDGGSKQEYPAAFEQGGPPKSYKKSYYQIDKSLVVLATAYSSTADQTDETPLITANGKTVYDGLIAANFLSFGTKLRIPEIYGDKIFTVDDRMHKRFSNRVDVWMKTREEATRFGLKSVKIEVLSSK